VKILFLIFLLIPIIEIYFLIEIGEVIGAIPTVFLVVFTAVLGAQLLRFQGLSALQRVQASMARGEMPAVELLEGVVMLVGGALLLTPGFFTDALGFMCLIPPLRRKIIFSVIARFFRFPDGGGPSSQSPPHGPRTIEGEYQRLDDDK